MTYFQAKLLGKPLVMLPIPIVGRIQHRCAVYNADFGTIGPKDIEGKRVGVRTYSQTTGVWIRGVLQHEYGVNLDEVIWVTNDESHVEEFSDPPNCERLPEKRDIPHMMLEGEVTAALLGNDTPNDDRIRTLMPDAVEAGKEWSWREQVVPVNHMFVVHADLAAQRPDVVREIYRLLVESRNAASASANN